MRPFQHLRTPASAGALFYRLAASLENPGPAAPALRFDHARVQKTRHRLRQGRFAVDSRLVAERLVERLRGVATAPASLPAAG